MAISLSDPSAARQKLSHNCGLAQKDADAAQVHEASGVLKLVLVPHQNAPEVLKPGEEALHLPAPAESAQFAPILRLAPLGPIGRDHINATLMKHLIQAIAVVGLISDQALRSIERNTLFEYSFNKGDLRR